MWRVRRPLSLTALVSVLALAAAAPASADPYDDYRRDGSINPCNYSADELQRSRDALPPDVIQYSPGLADQLAAGQEGCGGQAPGGGPETRDSQLVPALPSTGGGGTAGTRRARILDPPTPKATEQVRLANLATPDPSVRPGSEEMPGWVLPLLGGLALLGLLAFLATRTLAGTLGGRPLAAGPGGRISDALTEAWESVRLGR